MRMKLVLTSPDSTDGNVWVLESGRYTTEDDLMDAIRKAAVSWLAENDNKRPDGSVGPMYYSDAAEMPPEHTAKFDYTAWFEERVRIADGDAIAATTL